MESDVLDESDLFRAVAKSECRALLIGRQAMVVYGLPMNTADYDYWLDVADIEVFNRALTIIGFDARHTPDEARARGRYSLEGHDKIDIVISRRCTLPTGPLDFEDVWRRRESLPYEDGVVIEVPCLEDLILTKQVGTRPKDLEDVSRLRDILARRGSK